MAKKETVTLVNTGLCMIIVGDVNLMPGQEMEIEKDKLETSAFQYLISRGEAAVKDNSALTEEVKAKANARRKKDPTEGKSRKELEDGGEF